MVDILEFLKQQSEKKEKDIATLKQVIYKIADANNVSKIEEVLNNVEQIPVSSNGTDSKTFLANVIKDIRK